VLRKSLSHVSSVIMPKSLIRWLLVFMFFSSFTPALRAVVAPFVSSGAVKQTQAQAQAMADPQEVRLARLEQQTADAKSSADNAWMLTSAALVLMMTGPGLALFYGGLVRKKNVLSTMMQSFAMMALISILWALVGYSLCFGSGNSFIGDLHHLFLRGVGGRPDPAYSSTIPQQTFMIYQLMFAIITPALITGAFAERMKFSAMALFMVLWSVLVYDPRRTWFGVKMAC
jgi:Amt family ammonium transporter